MFKSFPTILFSIKNKGILIFHKILLESLFPQDRSLKVFIQIIFENISCTGKIKESRFSLSDFSQIYFLTKILTVLFPVYQLYALLSTSYTKYLDEI